MTTTLMTMSTERTKTKQKKLHPNQVKCTPQDGINELIIWNLNPLVVSRMQ